MKIVYVVLFSLLIVAVIGLVAWFLIWQKLHGANKKILFSVAVAGAVLFVVLLALTACIPSKADKYLALGIETIEKNLNTISDDYVNKEMDAEQIKASLAEYRQIETYLSENNEAGLVIRLISAGAYIRYFKQFVNSIDANISDMQANGTPITIHNVLLRLQDKSAAPIVKATKILEIVIIVLAFVFALILIIASAILQHDEKEGSAVFVSPSPEPADK